MFFFFSWKDTWKPGEGGSHFYLRKKEKEQTTMTVYLTEDLKGLRSKSEEEVRSTGGASEACEGLLSVTPGDHDPNIFMLYSTQ